MQKLTPYMQYRLWFVRKYHGEGKSKEWMAQKLEVTRERVRQLLKMAK